MRTIEIINEIKNLGVYTKDQFKEYLSYFSNSEYILNGIDASDNAQVSDNMIETRIRSMKGSQADLPDLSISDKIVPMESLESIFKEPSMRKGQTTIGVVSGCYDLLHLGHARGMNYAKKFLMQYDNPKLVVLTMSDLNIRAKKGDSRPILDINERLGLICGIDCVDYVIPMSDPNCLETLRMLRPRYFFKANADRSQEIVRKEMELVESYGGIVQVFPPGHPGESTSTTSTINHVLDKLMKEW